MYISEIDEKAVTVASAAPSMPIRGKPALPKINR